VQATPPPGRELVPSTTLAPRAERLLPEGLVATMRADPTHAPEHLALAAVERFGPEARAWAAAMRARYPAATPEQLDAHVRTRFVRLSRYSGAAAGVLGLPGAIADAGVLAYNQARMVLHIAALHGHDPTARERAAEILVLQGVHKVTSIARTALDVAARRASTGDLLRHGGGSTLALAGALGRMVGLRLLTRGLVKAIPLASIPLGAMANAGSTKRLADRAVGFYSGRRQLTP